MIDLELKQFIELSIPTLDCNKWNDSFAPLECSQQSETVSE